jgi:hypothetical protein
MIFCFAAMFQHGPSPRPPLFPNPPRLLAAGGPIEPNVLFPAGKPQNPNRFSQPQNISQPRFGNQPMNSQQHQLSMAPSLLTTNFHPPPGYADQPQHHQPVDFRSMYDQMAHEDSVAAATANTDSATIDLQMRKHLPAWIREGLEKMEREKQKMQELEQENAKEKDSSSNAGAGGGVKIPKWRLEDTEGVSSFYFLQHQ